MKILNSTTRDASDELIKTPISELDETTELPDDSLFLSAIPAGNGYQAKKIEAKKFNNKVYESVNNTFKTDFWDTHLGSTDGVWNLHTETSPYKEMIAYLSEMHETYPNNIEDVPTPEPIPDQKKDSGAYYSFVDHVNYDFELIRRYVDAKDYEFQVEIDDIKVDISSLNCFFDKNMLITTTCLDSENQEEETHISVNHNKSENETYCQMSIDDGNKISSTWTVPATGNLVIYGWLDSSSALNNKSIPTSYCVIEAQITSEKNGSQWEVIGVQSVIPAKTFTYVGFNLLVKKGLVIRARCGFIVGGKSGQYSNEQDGYDTLANSTINGFKCQVFSEIDE